MEQLVTLARWGLIGFVSSLLAIILFKLLTGNISLDGLLTGEQKDGAEYFSVGRSQLLLFTLVSAIGYVKQVLSNPSLTTLPAPSHMMLGVLGTSHILYLAGKARALLFGPATQSSSKGNEQ